VQLDKPVDQFQPPATLVVGSDVLADRPPHATVMDFDPQITIGVRQPHLDQPSAMTQCVGHQLTHDELGQVGVLAQAPPGQGLPRLFAGVAGVRWLAAEPAGDGYFAGGGQRHSALLTGTWSQGASRGNERAGSKAGWGGWGGMSVLSFKGELARTLSRGVDRSVTLRAGKAGDSRINNDVNSENTTYLVTQSPPVARAPAAAAG
jgi:hypothetical protein